MKNQIALIVLVIVIAALGVLLYRSEQDKAKIQAELEVMNQHALSLEKDIVALQNDITELEKKTFKGAVDEANRAIVDGWESFINRVQKELDEVQEEIDKEFGENQPDSGSPEHHQQDPIKNT